MKSCPSQLVFLWLLILTVVSVTSCIECYYGWTSDGDDEPEDEWGFFCNPTEVDHGEPPTGTTVVVGEGQGNEEGEGCVTTCNSATATCYKLRYEGEQGFFSVYGCVEDPSDISAGANIPDDLKADDLQLDYLPTDDECIDNDDYSVPSEDVYHMPYDELGGVDSAVYCTCLEDRCNDARMIKSHVFSASLISLTLSLFV